MYICIYKEPECILYVRNVRIFALRVIRYTIVVGTAQRSSNGWVVARLAIFDWEKFLRFANIYNNTWQ